FDVASGTSVFTVIPSPASLALLGLGGLAIRRRRR
ncbi:MAG: PEP-CTERM sorting domain-containing protein, partial [Planctomycetota bacterium]